MTGLRGLVEKLPPTPWVLDPEYGIVSADEDVLGAGFPEGVLFALAPDLALWAADAADALTRLEEWDMLTLDSEGKGQACHDAPWARRLIEPLLARFAVIQARAEND